MDSIGFRPLAEDVLIWEENWETWQVFEASLTQWRISPGGGVMGLDYSAVESVMRFLQIKDLTDTFRRLQLLEGVVVSVFAESKRAEDARAFHHR